MKEYTEIVQKLNGDREHDVYTLMAGLRSIGLYDIADLKSKLIREVDYIVESVPADEDWIGEEDYDKLEVCEGLLEIIDDLAGPSRHFITPNA
jgi:hypothetical protein